MYDTKVIPCTEGDIATAAEFLKRGEVVAIPTETVYGLAANALNTEAVSKIFKAKGRPQDNPLIVHICGLKMLNGLVASFPETAQKLAAAFWPGPLTMILPKSDKLPSVVSAGLDTVGIRMPNHRAALEVIRKSGLPLAAPSANVSGKPSPTRAEHVYEDLEGKIPLILDGGPCEVGVESTVALVLPGSVRILRPGAVTKEKIEELGLKVETDPAVGQELAEDAEVLSPGMKYKHYAPKADVILVKGPLDKFAEYVNNNAVEGAFALLFAGEKHVVSVPGIVYGSKDKPETQAAGLFDALRRADQFGAKTVFARSPDTAGVGSAVYNRMLRAAAFKVVEL